MHYRISNNTTFMSKNYTRILIALCAITLIGIWGNIHAQTVNGTDDGSVPPASVTQDPTNGSDDTTTTPSIMSAAIPAQSTSGINGSDDTSSSSTTDSTTGSAVATSTNGSDDVGTSSQMGSTATSTGIASTTNGDDDSQTTVATTTPTVTVSAISSGGGSGGGSFYGSNSSGGGSIFPFSVLGTTTPLATFISCPLLTDFLQIGTGNNKTQVLKLQAFLNTQGFPLTLSGIFDTKTETAVKAFQSKYLIDVMGPWKATAPSGIVYITTKKKINELACKSPLTLTPAELATINAYIANQNGNSTVVGPSIENGTGTSTSTTSPLIGENTTSGGSNTASVINANILERFWNFLKNIF